MAADRPSADDIERATSALDVEPVAWRAVTRGGQTAASRWVATLPDGSTRFTGDRLLHFDIRSDNLCLRDGRALLIDWNFACLGNPVFDLAAWLPSLHAEGGPAPEQILDTTDEVAAIASLLAGNFGLRGAGPDLQAPHVRPLQRKQAAAALPWAARCLGLSPPMV